MAALLIEFDDRTLAPIAGDPASGDRTACRHTVEAHGGTLAVERPPLGGYRFLLELSVWTT